MGHCIVQNKFYQECLVNPMLIDLFWRLSYRFVLRGRGVDLNNNQRQCVCHIFKDVGHVY